MSFEPYKKQEVRKILGRQEIRSNPSLAAFGYGKYQARADRAKMAKLEATAGMFKSVMGAGREVYTAIQKEEEEVAISESKKIISSLNRRLFELREGKDGVGGWQNLKGSRSSMADDMLKEEIIKWETEELPNITKSKKAIDRYKSDGRRIFNAELEKARIFQRTQINLENKYNAEIGFRENLENTVMNSHDIKNIDNGLLTARKEAADWASLVGQTISSVEASEYRTLIDKRMEAKKGSKQEKSLSEKIAKIESKMGSGAKKILKDEQGKIIKESVEELRANGNADAAMNLLKNKKYSKFLTPDDRQELLKEVNETKQKNIGFTKFDEYEKKGYTVNEMRKLARDDKELNKYASSRQTFNIQVDKKENRESRQKSREERTAYRTLVESINATKLKSYTLEKSGLPLNEIKKLSGTDYRNIQGLVKASIDGKLMAWSRSRYDEWARLPDKEKSRMFREERDIFDKRYQLGINSKIKNDMLEEAKALVEARPKVTKSLMQRDKIKNFFAERLRIDNNENEWSDEIYTRFLNFKEEINEELEKKVVDQAGKQFSDDEERELVDKLLAVELKKDVKNWLGVKNRTGFLFRKIPDEQLEKIRTFDLMSKYDLLPNMERRITEQYAKNSGVRKDKMTEDNLARIYFYKLDPDSKIDKELRDQKFDALIKGLR